MLPDKGELSLLAVGISLTALIRGLLLFAGGDHTGLGVDVFGDEVG
jgi:hypothetical protein